MLAKAGSSVKLAKVDTTVEKELGKRFKIEGYPTLKFFQYGDYPAPAPAITPIFSPFLLNPCTSLSPCSFSCPSLSDLYSCPCSHFILALASFFAPAPAPHCPISDPAPVPASVLALAHPPHLILTPFPALGLHKLS